MAIIYNFPDELVSSEAKLSKEFAREYALAMWNEWDSTYHIRYNKLKKDNKVNEDYFKSKLRAIENINFMLINNDEAIVRTEKFIESILTKKR